MTSLRLNFKIRKSSILLEDFEKIDILPPPSDSIEDTINSANYFLYLYDGSGKLFYVQNLYNPFIDIVESFTNQDNETYDIDSSVKSNKGFSIIVPDPNEEFTIEIKVKSVQNDFDSILSETIFRFQIRPVRSFLKGQSLKKRRPRNKNGRVVGSPIQLYPERDTKKSWNILFLAEGYLNNDDEENNFSKFKKDVDKIVKVLENTKPFNGEEFRDKINPCLLNVESLESCKLLTNDCSSSNNKYVRSFFKASFCRNDNTARTLSVDQNIVRNVVKRSAENAHSLIVLVNTNHYGGSGSLHLKLNAAVVSTSSIPPNHTPPEVALHELGHSAFRLGDEYDRDWPGKHAYDLKDFKNLTDETDFSKVPWTEFLDEEYKNIEKIPAKVNTCSNSDRGKPLSSSLDLDAQINRETVGIFEGGFYSSCGVYRSQQSCIMRHKAYPRFCVRCQSLITVKLREFLSGKRVMV